MVDDLCLVNAFIVMSMCLICYVELSAMLLGLFRSRSRSRFRSRYVEPCQQPFPQPFPLGFSGGHGGGYMYQLPESI